MTTGRSRWHYRPMATGRLLQGLRDHFEQSKYSVQKESGVNHSFIFNIESGKRPFVEYHTLLKIASGIGTEGGTGLGQEERIKLLEAMLGDRLMYEVAKWGIYYLGTLAEGNPALEAAIEEARKEFVGFIDRERDGETEDGSLVRKVGTYEVDVRTATGTELLAAIAEHPGAHELRLAMLEQILAGIDLNVAGGHAVLHLRVDEGAAPRHRSDGTTPIPFPRAGSGATSARTFPLHTKRE